MNQSWLPIVLKTYFDAIGTNQCSCDCSGLRVKMQSLLLSQNPVILLQPQFVQDFRGASRPEYVLNGRGHYGREHEVAL